MYMALSVHYGPWTPPNPRSRAHGRSPRLAAVELKENGEAVSGNENLETSSDRNSSDLCSIIYLRACHEITSLAVGE